MENLADLEPFLVRNGPTIVNNRIFSDESILYEGQTEVLRNIIQDASPVYVAIMPNGTGKTSVISCLPYMFGWAAVENGTDFDFNKPILVIAPDATSLHQLERSLCYNLENVSSFLTRSLRGDERRLLYRTDIIKNQTSIRNVDEVGVCDVVLLNQSRGVTQLNNDHFSVVIVDEAHLLSHLQWTEIIDHFHGHARVIFLTPPRKCSEEIFIGDKKFPINKFSLRYETAVKQKIIRDVTLTPVDECELLYIIKSKLEKKNKNFPLPKGIKHAAIVITPSISESKIAREKCLSLGWRDSDIKLVNSKSEDDSRDTMLEDIQKGSYDLIIIVKMLLQGLYYPPLSVAGILTKIDSRDKFAQFVSRIQQPFRYSDFEDNITGDIITAKEFEQDASFMFNELYKQKK